jgi:hypothetical protein
MDEWYRWMPERWRHLHWVYDAGFSRQIYAVHEPAARIAAFFERGDDLWTCDSRVAPVYAGLLKQGAFVEETDGPMNAFGEATRIAAS